MSQRDGAAVDSVGVETADDGPDECDFVETPPVPADGDRRIDVAGGSSPGKMPRPVRWVGRHWAGLLVVVLLAASTAAAAGVYWHSFRPDRQVDAAVSKQVLEAASQGTVSTLTYHAETFDKDLAAAKAHLTGEFLKYYGEFAEQLVAPAVKRQHVDTTASVVKAAVSELHPDRAVVLLFVDQVTTSAERPDPATATSSVLVTVTRTQIGWQISEFKPV